LDRAIDGTAHRLAAHKGDRSMSQNNHSAKKTTVLQRNKLKLNPVAVTLALALVITAAAVAYYLTDASVAPSKAVSVQPAGSSQVSYPVSMFADGAARHFDFKADGMTIRYFILKSSDGVIRAAFDACDVCWPAGKGYYQDGDDMVCRNCGRRFASVLVNEVKGGCNPAPLTRTVNGDRLVLKVDDILQGKSYFDFQGKA
jgi:uncharacterized membrane protein